MPFETETVAVRSSGPEQWELLEPLAYRGRRQRFVVPAGFRTDLATVPRVLVWFVPRWGLYTRAAVLHDWLITEGIAAGAVTSRDADGLFRRVLRESGVPVVRRWLMWCGVRWGALGDARRRRGWVLSAPGVLGITVLAGPLLLPPALLIVPALAVYGAVERLVARVHPRSGRPVHPSGPTGTG